MKNNNQKLGFPPSPLHADEKLKNHAWTDGRTKRGRSGPVGAPPCFTLRVYRSNIKLRCMITRELDRGEEGGGGEGGVVPLSGARCVIGY